MVVYLITNKVNGKYYVGKTKGSVADRWYCHCHPQYHHLALVKAIKKYGEDAFIVEVICTTSSELELSQLEKLWIILLRSYDPKVGYNMTYGGEGVNCPRTPEWIAKIKATLKGRKPPGYRPKRTLSEEHKRKIKQALKGRKVPSE